jgi:hypothetical protein
MEMDWPADIKALDDGLAALERETQALAAGLTEAEGGWRPREGAWSVAECFDHLATSNRVYLVAMREAADGARQQGRMRRRPAMPGLFGGMFVRSLEPPPSRFSKLKAPQKIRPRTAPPLSDALGAFVATQHDARAFLREFADLDLAGVTFVNPFIPGVRFSLATGLHVIVAHEKRHLWQARNVREQAERAAPGERSAPISG